jgi:hypothetical protein
MTVYYFDILNPIDFRSSQNVGYDLETTIGSAI